MYSNSSSFLGGGSSGRPGPPQYVQASYLNPQQPQQQNVLSQQPTGFGGGQLQSQYTGYPGQQQGLQAQQLQQQQPQYTGFPQQVPPGQGYVLPQQQFQTSQQASQQASQPAIQPPQPPIAMQQTSSQIAQSFQSIPTPNPTPATGAKIPKIRLSFLTAQDQAKFEQLFKSAVGEGQSLDGNKVKELLIRSKLSGSDLMKIWVLSDTTKSGQLLFPEFALAMYLCNLRIVGKDLPNTLPERITNEVSSMVDIISFGVADDRPQSAPRSNAPNFDSPSTTPSIQQPQPQASNSQLLSQLTSQPTGFAAQYIPPQPTGFPNQLGAFGSQPTALGQQQSIYQQNPQAVGYSGPLPPMPPIPSNYSANLSPAQTGGNPGGQVFPLNAQPTGVPGQWGLVNTPASGLPNIEALQQRMMPQPGREGGYTTAGLAGSAKVPWAVTKDEKKIYDLLFKAWDGLNKGFIGGDAAIEAMGQSGLPKSDLEKIWTLSDPGNKGKLDMDEFAVAMHLIYRKLNGYPVPNQLPPELVPPSTRNFADSIGTVKSLLSQDAETRKNSSAFLQPQQTGVSYLKNRSFRTDSSGIAAGRKDATVFRNNDDDVGYRSSARRRVGDGGRTPSPLQSTSYSSEKYDDDLSVEQLRKKVREKQMLLDGMDVEAESDADEEDRKVDISDGPEDLYRRIQQIQDDLDNLPRASPRTGDTEAGRRTLRREVQRLADRVPELESNIRKTEQNIYDAKTELSRVKDANKHTPNRSERKTGLSESPRAVVTTSSAGTYSSYKTAEDRASYIKQQAEQRMAERLAALGLKPPTILGESSQQRHEREVRERQERRERALQAEADDDKREQERQLRIAAERPTPPPGGSTIAKKPPPPPSRKGRSDSSSQRVETKRKADEAAAQLEIRRKADDAATEAEAKRRAEADVRQEAERAAERIAEREAEQRAKEREVTSRKQAQEAKVKEIAHETRRQEEELAKERESAQARLKALEEQVRQGKVKKLEEKRRKQAAEKEAKEREEREEREAKLAVQRADLQAAREREMQLKLQLESLDDDDSSDEDGPQDITPQGTTPTSSQVLSRDFGPHSIQSPTPSTHESIEAPAASNAPVASPPTQIQNNESKNPFFKKLNQNTDSAATPTTQPSSSTQEPSTNPFHRLTQQESAPKSPVVAQSEPHSQAHFPPLSSTPSSGQRPSRVRPEEDEWSVVDSNEDSSDDESDRPSGGTAKHLASILFGTMGPPRPLSAMDEKDKPKTPVNDSPATPTTGASINSDSAPTPPPPPTGLAFGGAPYGASPPPPTPITGAPQPPPMPNVGAPPPPTMPNLGAPPPPPLPGANFSAGPPPIVAGFLGDIVRGKGLRKVETKDRSQASVAGRVLN